jgi:hypothetical protein
VKYEQSIFLGDPNINLIMNIEKSLKLRQKMENVSFTVVSREAANFSAAAACTNIDRHFCNDVTKVNTFFSQLFLPEMSSELDLIYGSYKI